MGTPLEDSLRPPGVRHCLLWHASAAQMSSGSSELQLQLPRPNAQSAALSALCRLIHMHQGIYEALHSLTVENYGLTVEGA
jgi:hypothetical protein